MQIVIYLIYISKIKVYTKTVKLHSVSFLLINWPRITDPHIHEREYFLGLEWLECGYNR